MGRATIPYEDLQTEISRRYQAPSFKFAIVRSNRANSPTRVYDRRTGNYAPIGWRVVVDYQQFFGFSDASVNPIYVVKSETVIIEL
jgi:hypothetical protein